MQDLSVFADTLANFKSQIARDERYWFSPGEIVEDRHAAASHLENVTESFCSDKADFGAGQFNTGIGDNSGSMNDFSDRGRIDLLLDKNVVNAQSHRAAVIVRCGKHFLGYDCLPRPAEEDIGES